MIHLKPMLECDSTKYLSWAIKDFAQDKIDAANWQVYEALGYEVTNITMAKQLE